MNLHAPIRAGWLRYCVAAVLAATGVAGGLYLADYTDPGTASRASLAGKGVDSLKHRFDLSSLDVKDRNEAPEVAVDASGRIYLVWSSQGEPETRTLLFSRSEDAGGSFSPPREIARSGILKTVSQSKGKTVIRDSKMAAHLNVQGENLYLAWTETLPGNSGLRMVVVTSSDQGTTFGSPIQVHQGQGARPTFTALAAGPSGMLLCSWLDNRNQSQQVYASLRRVGQSAFEPEEVVHIGDEERGVCPCCPTASLIGPDGASYVAFRNVADACRDIFIGRKKEGASEFEVLPVVPPTWKFNGCPHDGPSIVIVGDVVHVAWMDARYGPQRRYHASAKLADMKFTSQGLHAIEIGSQGNARLQVDGRGTVHAVWEESSEVESDSHVGHQHDAAPNVGNGHGRAIMYATLPVGGKAFTRPRAVAAKEGAFQTRPSVAATGAGKIIVAFNELDETGKAVVVATFDGEVRR